MLSFASGAKNQVGPDDGLVRNVPSGNERTAFHPFYRLIALVRAMGVGW
jgi:hypothetical protein